MYGIKCYLCISILKENAMIQKIHIQPCYEVLNTSKDIPYISVLDPTDPQDNILTIPILI
jgi:hypothetical protein